MLRKKIWNFRKSCNKEVFNSRRKYQNFIMRNLYLINNWKGKGKSLNKKGDN